MNLSIVQKLNTFPNNSNYIILCKAYKNVPKCISTTLELSGILRTKNFSLANIIWKLLKYEKMHALIPKLNEYQRYNHFPCTWQIGRKDRLWRNFKRTKNFFREDYNFIPETYILPEDHEDFIKAYEAHREKNWIIKPCASSRGRGIKLMTSLESVPEKCLISNYISNPLLIERKKFDLRLYVLVTSYNPLKVYIYREGLVRFASEEYKYITQGEVIDEKLSKFIHLTNYSINKNSSNYDKNISAEDQCLGSKWSLSALQKYFIEKGLNYKQLWSKIQDIIIKAIMLNADETIGKVRELTDKRNNLFELYGFDIILDDNLSPWLLEININPSLDCETDLDIKVKTNVITDIMNTLGLIPYDHNERENQSESNISNPPTLDEDLEKYKRYIVKNNFDIEIFQSHNKGEIENLKNASPPKLFSETKNQMTAKLLHEAISKEFNKNKSAFNIADYLSDFLNNPETEKILVYTNSEFSRNQNFDLIFPIPETYKYYSQFILQPEIENIILWSLIERNLIKYPN